MKQLALTALLLLLTLGTPTGFALEQDDPYLPLHPDLPPSLYTYIDRAFVLNMREGSVRMVPAVSGIDRAAFLARLDAAGVPPFVFAHIDSPYPPDHGGPMEALCECSLLGEAEFIVSEMPFLNADGQYVSVNDESYKAVLELIRYPFTDIELASVALSELAYVYNSEALRIFLEDKGFELLDHAGFMNSSDYPGYRDSQYLVTRGIDTLFVVVRGTSGALDIETTVDAELVPLGQLGLVHGGYFDIARHIRESVLELVQRSNDPVVVTGHSLGGSVSLMLTLMLMTDGLAVQNLNFAPVPLVDFRVASVFAETTNIVNYFLPNEELGSLEAQGDWLYLPGEREIMADVGTTAGAAHFVINYLKSMLVKKQLSKKAYEDDMPDCVVIKYACFDGDELNFISACAFDQDHCMQREFELLTGLPASIEPSAAMLEAEVRRVNRRLLETGSAHEYRALTHRLVYLLIQQGNGEAARRLFASLAPGAKENGFSGYLRRQLSDTGP